MLGILFFVFNVVSLKLLVFVMVIFLVIVLVNYVGKFFKLIKFIVLVNGVIIVKFFVILSDFSEFKIVDFIFVFLNSYFLIV